MHLVTEVTRVAEFGARLEVGDVCASGVCNGVGDPAGNRILLHHRYKPYEH
jgi:hypothetical protein